MLHIRSATLCLLVLHILKAASGYGYGYDGYGIRREQEPKVIEQDDFFGVKCYIPNTWYAGKIHHTIDGDECIAWSDALSELKDDDELYREILLNLRIYATSIEFAERGREIPSYLDDDGSLQRIDKKDPKYACSEASDSERQEFRQLQMYNRNDYERRYNRNDFGRSMYNRHRIYRRSIEDKIKKRADVPNQFTRIFEKLGVTNNCLQIADKKRPGCMVRDKDNKLVHAYCPVIKCSERLEEPDYIDPDRRKSICDKKALDIKCLKYSNGEKYQGPVNYYDDFVPCAYWNSTISKEKLVEIGITKPDSEYLTENACRNPKKDRTEKSPWCFSKDGEKKYCKIKMCPYEPPISPCKTSGGKAKVLENRQYECECEDKLSVVDPVSKHSCIWPCRDVCEGGTCSTKGTDYRCQCQNKENVYHRGEKKCVPANGLIIAGKDSFSGGPEAIKAFFKTIDAAMDEFTEACKADPVQNVNECDLVTIASLLSMVVSLSKRLTMPEARTLHASEYYEIGLQGYLDDLKDAQRQKKAVIDALIDTKAIIQAIGDTGKGLGNYFQNIADVDVETAKADASDAKDFLQELKAGSVKCMDQVNTDLQTVLKKALVALSAELVEKTVMMIAKFGKCLNPFAWLAGSCDGVGMAKAAEAVAGAANRIAKTSRLLVTLKDFIGQIQKLQRAYAGHEEVYTYLGKLSDELVDGNIDLEKKKKKKQKAASATLR